MNAIRKNYLTQAQSQRLRPSSLLAVVGLLLISSCTATVIAFAGDYPNRIHFDAQQDPNIINYCTPGFEERDSEKDIEWPIWVEDRRHLDRQFSDFDLYFSDVAFVGRIVEYEKRCFTPPTGVPESIVVIRFRVESSYWGVRYPEIVVEAQTNQGQDCIYYKPPPFTEFTIDDTFLFLGRIDGVRTRAFNYRGLLSVTKDAFVSAHGWRLPLQETEELLVEASRCRSYEQQAQESDAICEVMLTANGRDVENQLVTVSVVKSHKGQIRDNNLDIAAVTNQNPTFPCDLPRK